ncbi:tubulin-specific chaperone cofactor E-like protein [Paramacrobiotus metropolitanus]|uniref:tubulin-specific chaperone cofactor E-like protein n=1 Tax=Paramacrobiotus metropolitanus TaxID=2943436 RepID=UPI002445B06C|nr:tubulin-specific chaperone cofactor E-like protein [Paramacrobiotus metropolitanus]
MEGEALRDSLPAVSKLHLSHTELSSWPALDQLQHLPSLTDLRLLNTPLWTDSPLTGSSPPSSPSKSAPFSPTLTTRQHVLARLPALSSLNGTPVDAMERMDAERAFLRHFHGADVPPPCPRFTELLGRYGPLAPLLDVQLGAPEYVEVGLSYGSVQRRPFKVNVKQTVGQLRQELQKGAGMRCRVFYLDAVLAGVVGMEEMRGERRAVHSFNVRDGSPSESAIITTSLPWIITGFWPFVLCAELTG